MLAVAVVAGLIAGLGVLLVVRELAPSQPHLASALARLSGPDVHAVSPGQTAPGMQARLGRGLERRLHERSFVRVPTRELALLRTTTQEWFGQKALYALIGLLFPPLFVVVLRLTGVPLPVAAPVAGSVLLAAALWFVPDIDARVKAGAAREEFARAVTAYIDLTALERAGGSGATQALERAALVGDSWVFERLREELQRARWAGVAPWEALGALSIELGVPELGDLADIMRLSGEQGAAVYENLRARSRGMRAALLSREETRANVDSERMVIPVAFLGLIFLAILAYPAMVRVL